MDVYNGILKTGRRLYFVRQCSTVFNKLKENKLLKYFQMKIKATGPITVAEYMKDVLTNPLSGYYMHKDVFGCSGDFITSPEISQMFGELIAVWFLNEWSRLGQPKPFQLVEFGPGRGTLANDILRVFDKLNVDKETFSLHLVEISPFLCEVQKKELGILNKSTTEFDNKSESNKAGHNSEISMVTKNGIPVTWHQHLKTVPEQFSLFLGHEFFDALPIHKFQKTDKGWREILIDCKTDSDDNRLHFVLSHSPTLSSRMYIDPQEKRNHVEISPESGILVQQLTTRMEEFGGISLIIDYGHNGTGCDTFRSFHKHKQQDPLFNPGTADLTADVDFSYLKKCAQDRAVVFGPQIQSEFLKCAGIEIRLEKLLQSASTKDQELLKSGYDMLTNANKMGTRFQFLAMFPLVVKDFLTKYPPVGFR